MKKSIIRKAALAVIGIGLFAVCAEASSAMAQFLWSGSWLAAMAGSAVILNKMEKEA
jgi:hypothetical protein